MSASQNNNKFSVITEEDAVDFVLRKFSAIKNIPRVNELVKFHTINKYFLMSHSQKYLKILGNIVANHENRKLSDAIVLYEENLRFALDCKPTIKSNANVLMHIYGGFSKLFSTLERELYMNLVNLYINEKNTLGKTLSEIEPLVYRFNNTYLASQSYFQIYADIKKGNLFSMLSAIK